MTKTSREELSPQQIQTMLSILQKRFEQNMNRHTEINWAQVQAKLTANTQKVWSLQEMESTGGEPDLVGYDSATGEYLFFDCAPESPAGRRSICYDRQGQDSRKEHKPHNNAQEWAAALGVSLPTEAEYRAFQQLGRFDTKTSSWIATPADIRKLGGALFAEFRYGQVFVYHNGAQSYYAVRGFRGLLRV